MRRYPNDLTMKPGDYKFNGTIAYKNSRSDLCVPCPLLVFKTQYHSGHLTPVHMPTLTRFRFLARALGAVLTASAVHAYDLGGIDFHGSLSSTAAYSNNYNYLGDTAESADLIQNEVILNGTKRFDNGLKAAAQVYIYSFAGYNTATLDFANLDYSVTQEFGIRVGRNKTPIGFYSESQDLDQIRTFASLPLNFYPRSFRAFAVANDGISFYGNVAAEKAGTFDYQIFYGQVPSLDEQQPTMVGEGLRSMRPNMVYGGSVIWNAPVDGLRFGYSYLQTAGASLTTNPAVVIANVFSTPFSGDIDYTTQVTSAEYTWGKWTATTEYRYTSSGINLTNDKAGLGGAIPASSIVKQVQAEKDEFYLQLTYQATDKLGLGVYYAYSDYTPEGTQATNDKGGIDTDLAFATSYAIKPWWLIKGEVHLMNGIHSLNGAGNSNPGAPTNTTGGTDDQKWTYYVLKTTLSF